jgi:broad specificity phosphatase PhoE
MIIYLIRHGESTSDIDNLYGGDYDDHLTENGKAQA